MTLILSFNEFFIYEDKRNRFGARYFIIWTKKTMKYKKKYQRKNTRGYDFFNNELFLLLYNCFCNISINISHRVHR